MQKTWLASSLAALAALAVHGSCSAFTTQDVEVCPAYANVLDPEFDSKSQLMVFMDSQARVRVTSLRADGTVGPAGCAGTIIDQGTWGWPGNTGGYNGPEWARSQLGGRRGVDGDAMSSLDPKRASHC